MPFPQSNQNPDEQQNLGQQGQEENTVVDQTALQIADMLDIDLSTVATAEEGTQLVTNAITDLIYKLNELNQGGQPGGDPNAEQQEEEPEVDEEGNPIEQQEEEPEVDEEGNPIEQQEGEEPQEEEPEEEEEPQQMPMMKKKKPQGFAASFSPMMLKLARQNYTLQLSALAEKGHLIPAVMRKISKQVVSSDMALSLSLDEESGGRIFSFDDLVNILEANGPTVNFTEKTGHQSSIELPQGIKLELSADEQRDPKYNPMVADAASRRKQ